MKYELVLELPEANEEQALAVARDIRSAHAGNVTVYHVVPGKSFADPDERALVATIEAAT